MESIITKQEFDELMAMNGQERGQGIIEAKAFILKEKGKEGLEKLEDVITKLGYSEYKKIKSDDFYPLGLAVATLVAINRLFNFGDKEFEEMGIFESKFSVVIRFLMKYLVSLERLSRGAPRVWKRYFTVGELEITEYDKKSMIVKLENFRAHPIFCSVFKGYFSGVVEMIVNEKITADEKKCIYRGDKYHEFLLKW